MCGKRAAAWKNRHSGISRASSVTRISLNSRLRLTEANRRDRSTCVSASTFTAKYRAGLNAPRLGLDSRGDHNTSGGASDSELNELAVRPMGAPCASTQRPEPQRGGYRGILRRQLGCRCIRRG